MSAKQELADLKLKLYAPTMPQVAEVVAGMNETLRGLPSWEAMGLQEKCAIAVAATVAAVGDPR